MKTKMKTKMNRNRSRNRNINRNRSRKTKRLRKNYKIVKNTAGMTSEDPSDDDEYTRGMPRRRLNDMLDGDPHAAAMADAMEHDEDEAEITLELATEELKIAAGYLRNIRDIGTPEMTIQRNELFANIYQSFSTLTDDDKTRFIDKLMSEYMLAHKSPRNPTFKENYLEILRRIYSNQLDLPKTDKNKDLLGKIIQNMTRIERM